MLKRRLTNTAGRSVGFILSPARAGSTLLRYILDSHPDIAVPPETNLASAAGALVDAWRAVSAEDNETVRADVRRAIRAPMDQYATARGKRTWCDKSPFNIDRVDVLERLFPDAGFILLHRHVMDVVHSGLEASSWGFGGYGYASYVLDSPENTVAALANAWCDATERMLVFSARTAVRTLSVRYEELVSSPEATVARVVSFLGHRPVSTLTREAMRSQHDIGAGDHKIFFANGIFKSSAGSGRVVPATAITGADRDRTNGLLKQIGYEPIDEEWNLAIRERDQLRSVASATILAPTIETFFDETVARFVTTAADRTVSAVVAVEDIGRAWLIEAREQAVCEVPVSTALTARDTGVIICAANLIDIVSGSENPAALLRTGAMRAKGTLSGVRDLMDLLMASRSA